jgi:hypothetical protein
MKPNKTIIKMGEEIVIFASSYPWTWHGKTSYLHDGILGCALATSHGVCLTPSFHSGKVGKEEVRPLPSGAKGPWGKPVKSR